MKKQIIISVALLAAASASFAESTTTFKVSGLIRAGLSSTIEDGAKLSTKTWNAGTYFSNGKTRSRLNFGFDGVNDNAKFGAYMRLQYDAGDAVGAKNWAVGSVKYADAYAGFANNMVTVAAGKIKDGWIASTGFNGYSVLDGTSGVVVNVVPVSGLNILGGAVIDNTKNTADDGTVTYNLGGDSFLGGVKYSCDAFNAMVSYAGWGVLAANVSYTGIQNLTLSAEGEYETAHGINKVGGQVLLADEWIQYTGVDKFTFGILSSQVYDSASVAADGDFSFAITPAVAYKLNDVVAFQLEGTWQQSVYDGAKVGYATIVPSVKLSADKSASATVWCSISTDSTQSTSSAGIGVIKEF